MRDTCEICKSNPRTECENGWIETNRLSELCDPKTNLNLYDPALKRCPAHAALIAATSLSNGLNSSGLNDAKYAGGWTEIDLTHKSWRVAHQISISISDVIAQGLNLVFAGGTGRGKTHAAVLICRAALEAGHSTLKTRWPDVLDNIRDSFNRKTELTEREQLEKLYKADLLLLDEVGGAETGFEGAKFSQSRLERVIGTRYDAGKPTIITANFNASDLAAVVGDRAASRIQARYLVNMFDGPEYRREREGKAVQELVQTLWSRASKPQVSA